MHRCPCLGYSSCIIVKFILVPLDVLPCRKGNFPFVLLRDPSVKASPVRVVYDANILNLNSNGTGSNQHSLAKALIVGAL